MEQFDKQHPSPDTSTSKQESLEPNKANVRSDVLPNFFIIGAGKSATSSIYNYLRNHPQIFMSYMKEPNFFSLENCPLDFMGPGDRDKGTGGFSITNYNDYVEQFCTVQDEVAIGEASVMYLYSEEAPIKIHRAIPHAKLIAILRDPVERAFSAYRMFVNQGRETLSFEEAIELAPQRAKENYEWFWQYVDVGFYARQIERYLKFFPREQMLILLYEDVNENLVDTLKLIYEFLGVDSDYLPQNLHQRWEGDPNRRQRSNWIGKLAGDYQNPVRRLVTSLVPPPIRKPLKRLIVGWNSVEPRIKPETRKRLITIFKPDILKLQDLLQRDLSSWLR